MKTMFLGVSLILAGVSICRGSVTFVWDGGTSSSPNAAPTSGSDPNITAGSFSQNNDNGTTTLLTTTSASTGYTSASGNENFGAAAKNGALSTSSTFFAVTLTSLNDFEIILNSISLGTRSTTTGPTTMTFFSSIDNFTTAIGTASITPTSGTSWQFENAVNFTGGSLTSSANSAVTLEIFGSGGSGASMNTANWRIDDISLSVTATSANTAVPEPAECGLVSALALLGICGVSIWRNHRTAKRA
jgi:hypothetical protein